MQLLIRNLGICTNISDQISYDKCLTTIFICQKFHILNETHFASRRFSFLTTTMKQFIHEMLLSTKSKYYRLLLYKRQATAVIFLCFCINCYMQPFRKGLQSCQVSSQQHSCMTKTFNSLHSVFTILILHNYLMHDTQSNVIAQAKSSNVINENGIKISLKQLQKQNKKHNSVLLALKAIQKNIQEVQVVIDSSLKINTPYHFRIC